MCVISFDLISIIAWYARRTLYTQLIPLPALAGATCIELKSTPICTTVYMNTTADL